MRQYSYIPLGLLFSMTAWGMEMEKQSKKLQTRNEHGSLTFTQKENWINKNKKPIVTYKRTLTVNCLAGQSYIAEVDFDDYCNSLVDYSFHLFSHGNKQYIHFCSQKNAVLWGFYLGNGKIVHKKVKPYFMINGKGKEYSTSLLYNFPELHNKVLKFNPLLVTKTRGNPIYIKSTDGEHGAEWHLSVPEEIKPSVSLLLDYFQQKNPFDASKHTCDLFFSALKGRTDKEQLIKYIAASHILGTYENKIGNETHLIDSVDYFTRAAIDASQKSCGWLPGNYEVTINPVGHVQLHQRGIYGLLKRLWGCNTTRTIFEPGNGLIQNILCPIKSYDESIIDQPKNKTTIISDIIEGGHRNTEHVVVNDSHIVRIMYKDVDDSKEKQIDIYDIHTQTQKSTHMVGSWDGWTIRDIKQSDNGIIDMLEARYSSYRRLQPKNNFTGLIRQQLKRYENGKLKQTIPIEKVKKSFVQESIEYETYKETNEKRPYFLLKQTGFWRTLLYRTRLILNNEKNNFKEEESIQLRNFINPFAWIRAIQQTWSAYIA